MIWLHAIFLLLGAAALVACSVGVKRNPDRGTELYFRPLGLGLGLVLMLLIWGMSLSVGQVESGHKGVVLQFGRPTGRIINEGPYFAPAFINTVVKMNTRTQKYEADAESASSDLQDVHTKIAVNFTIDGTQVDRVYRDLRTDYVALVMAPAVQEAVKAVTAKHDASSLITERENVKGEIDKALKERLSRHHIIVDNVSITNFDFSQSFKAAIEAKVSAAQRAQEAENRLLQIEVEARQAKISAEGRRDAAIAEAEGQAQSLLLVADAQSKANKLVAESLTAELIQYTLTQKLGPDVRVILLPSNQPFILGQDLITPSTPTTSR